MTYPLTEMNIAIAQEKASIATNDYIAAEGEHPFNCGFAWVVVKGVRGNKAKLLKEFGFDKRCDGPGLSCWNPGRHNTQDMSAKMAGAKVFAKELQSMGINAEAVCRLD